MKCPMCKKSKHVEPIPDGAVLVKNGKMKTLMGWICMMCSFSWAPWPSQLKGD